MGIKMKSEKSGELKTKLKVKRDVTPGIKSSEKKSPALKSKVKPKKDVGPAGKSKVKAKKVVANGVGDGPIGKKVEKKVKAIKDATSPATAKKDPSAGLKNKGKEAKNGVRKGAVEKDDKKAALNGKIKAKKDMAKGGFQVLKGPDGKPLSKLEARKAQKKLKEERRKKKSESAFVTGVEAKKIWEELRREDCPKDKQAELVDQLYSLVKTHVRKLVVAHDTARVIECLLARGDEKIRDALYNELKNDLNELIKSKYAVFFVQKLVQYGTKEQQARVFKALEGRIPRLARHKIANVVLELCFNEYCNSQQRSHFIQEFYGAEFFHFKDDSTKNVLDITTKHPEKVHTILKSLQENCNILVSKGCYNMSFVHTVLFNYMLLLNLKNDESLAKQRSEFVSSLRDVCVHLLHSLDGARLTMNTLWHGNAKDRKSLIKSFKGHIVKIALEEHGHMVFLALFDCVDDTKLVGKAIVEELTKNLPEVMGSKYGRYVITYLMAPRSTVYFSPGTVDILKQGDGNVNSKKSAEIRRRELYEVAAPAVLEYLRSNLKVILAAGGQSIVMLQEILKSSTKLSLETKNSKISEQHSSILTSLAEEAAKPFLKGDTEQNIVENPGTHMMLKKIIAQDKECKDLDGAVLFSQLLVNAFDSESIEAYIECNRGCFILANLIDTGIESVVSKIKTMLKPSEASLKKKKQPGAEILTKKLAEIK